MRIDTERVILEVQLRPELWDKTNELYKNRLARDKAWVEIAKALIPNFDHLNNKEKSILDKKIQQRWRTARDTYQKDKHSGEKDKAPNSGRKEKKKYAYYDILTFLDGVKNEDILSEARDDSEESSVEGLDEDNANSNQSEPILQPHSSVTIPSPPKRNKTIKTIRVENKQTDCIKCNQLELESDDLAFFQSLQPTLKSFTHYQKMLFRTKVLQLVMEIDHPVNQSHHNYYPSSNSTHSSHSLYENKPVLDGAASLCEFMQYNLTPTVLDSCTSTPLDNGSNGPQDTFDIMPDTAK